MTLNPFVPPLKTSKTFDSTSENRSQYAAREKNHHREGNLFLTPCLSF